MAKFKMLNDEAVQVVDKVAAKVTTVSEMTNEQLQELSMMISETIDMAKREIKQVADALSQVEDVVAGEITKRGISDRVQKQISMFDTHVMLEAKEV